MIRADIREQTGVGVPPTGWRQLVTDLARGVRHKRRLLILGTGQLAKDLCGSLLMRRTRAYDVVGFLDRDSARVGQRLVNPAIVGTFDQLFEIVEYRQVGTIAVCLEDRRAGLPVSTLLDLKAMGLEVVDGHDLYEQESGRLAVDVLKPSGLIFSSGFRRYKVNMALKRLTDLISSMLGLVLLSPLGVLIAGLIVIDSPGPVFYRQVRVGLNGRPYVMWKFRSMRQNAELDGARWAAIDDHRITRVGRWLRKLRIDELPQLINVMKGDMSLVGPRPERPPFVQELRSTIPYYDVRHTVRPGITGWAQVRFRYASSSDDAHAKLQYDLFYVKNLSLLLDARVLLETFRVVLLGEGAR